MLEGYGPRPYNPEIDGEIEQYLQSRAKGQADPLFAGPNPLRELLEKGRIDTKRTIIRIVQDFTGPDEAYIVDKNGKLKGAETTQNMSVRKGKKRGQSPEKILEGKLWSIQGLKISF